MLVGLSRGGITDDEEKDRVLGILVDAGAGAIEPVERFVREQDGGVAWGLRALAEIAPPDEVRQITHRGHETVGEGRHVPHPRAVGSVGLGEGIGSIVAQERPEAAVHPLDLVQASLDGGAGGGNPEAAGN